MAGITHSARYPALQTEGSATRPQGRGAPGVTSGGGQGTHAQLHANGRDWFLITAWKQLSGGRLAFPAKGDGPTDIPGRRNEPQPTPHPSHNGCLTVDHGLKWETRPSKTFKKKAWEKSLDRRQRVLRFDTEGTTRAKH